MEGLTQLGGVDGGWTWGEARGMGEGVEGELWLDCKTKFKK